MMATETYVYSYRYFPQFYWSVDYWCELYIGTIEVPNVSFEIELTIGEGEEQEIVLFTPADILSATLVEQVDPISLTLPISELNFKVYTTDPRFGIYAENEFSQSLTLRQPVRLYLTYQLQRFLMGTYYLDSWKSPAHYRYEFKAVDTIGLMDSITYDGSYWANDTSLQLVLADVLEPGGISFSISDELAEFKLRGFLPPGTLRESIQQIALAAGSIVLCYGDKSIYLEPVKLPYRGEPAIYTISDEERLEQQEINIKQIITDIEVNSHEYVGQNERIETIFQNYLEPGEYKIRFTKPYYNIEVTGIGYPQDNLATEDGFWLITEDGIELIVSEEYVYGPNYIYLYVYEPGGEVTITGYPMVEYRQTYSFRESGLSPYQTANSIKIENATLVNTSIASNVLALLRDYYRQRYEQKARTIESYMITPEDELLVKFHPGEVARISATDGKFIRGAIEQIDYDLAGGMLTKLRIVGVEDGN